MVLVIEVVCPCSSSPTCRPTTPALESLCTPSWLPISVPLVSLHIAPRVFSPRVAITPTCFKPSRRPRGLCSSPLSRRVIKPSRPPACLCSCPSPPCSTRPWPPFSSVPAQVSSASTRRRRPSQVFLPISPPCSTRPPPPFSSVPVHLRRVPHARRRPSVPVFLPISPPVFQHSIHVLHSTFVPRLLRPPPPTSPSSSAVPFVTPSLSPCPSSWYMLSPPSPPPPPASLTHLCS